MKGGRFEIEVRRRNVRVRGGKETFVDLAFVSDSGLIFEVALTVGEARTLEHKVRAAIPAAARRKWDPSTGDKEGG